MTILNYQITGCCLPGQATATASACIGQVTKRPEANPAYIIHWNERVNGDPDASGPWSLRAAALTITLEDGSALPGAPTDLAIYRVGDMDQVVVNKAANCVKFVLTKGLDDVSYKVTCTATFRDCDGIEQVLVACLVVLVQAV